MCIPAKSLLVIVAACLAFGPEHSLAEPEIGYGFGSAVAPDELKGFVSTLPDGRGLPQGSGSSSQGRQIYLARCASCHGVHLEGGLGDKLVGGRGTLRTDVAGQIPIRTVESFWPYATTLFDYIKRAMPMNAPGSLSDNEIYSVTAYILAAGRIIPAEAVLDAHTLANVRMPNHNGFIPDARPEHFPNR